MNRDILFRRQSDAFRHGEPDWIPDRGSDRSNGDELRTRIQPLQTVIPKAILVVEDDPYYVSVLREALPEGKLLAVDNWKIALKHLTQELYDLVIVSVGAHGPLDTMDLMRLQRYNGDELNFFTPFIATISEGYNWRFSEALHEGCLSAVQKPFTSKMIRSLIIDQFSKLHPQLGGQRTS